MIKKNKHPKFLVALFSAFFRLFKFINIKNLINKNLLNKTSDDNKIPTNKQLDLDIEMLGFYMEYVWPLISKIAKEKLICFFKYKLKKVLFKAFLFVFLVVLCVGLYNVNKINAQNGNFSKLREPIKEVKNSIKINKDTIFIPAERALLTKDNLDFFASEMDIKFWYYVRNQIIMESGFSSDLLIQNNNFFGMKFPGRRETTATEELNGHAKYKHWVYCLYDYKLWQDAMMKAKPMKEGEDYPQWLKRIRYAESESYSNALYSTNWYSYNDDKIRKMIYN